MISIEESPYTYEYKDYFKIYLKSVMIIKYKVNKNNLANNFYNLIKQKWMTKNN